jgi:hypothetical protein
MGRVEDWAESVLTGELAAAGAKVEVWEQREELVHTIVAKAVTK